MTDPQLARADGTPVREDWLPYGRQVIDDDDMQAVVDVLRSDYLTTGPTVAAFEEAFADFVGAPAAVAVSSGTAALHAAMYAIGIESGDEVIVPAITFAATANCVVFQGGTPIFADIDADTLLLDPASLEEKLTPRTKAVIAVDFAGQPNDYDQLRSFTDKHNLVLVDDACHALGARWRGQRVGSSLADLNAFSFHPVKHITTAEGGMITSDDDRFIERMRTFRNHGIGQDHRARTEATTFFYEITDLGYNYRLSDVHCALGKSQLRKAAGFVQRRQAIAERYDRALAQFSTVEPLSVHPEASHAYHLYVIKLNLERLTASRDEIFAALRRENIGVNVHYIPVYWHPLYQRMGYAMGSCPAAEQVYERILTLPIFPTMTDDDADDVVAAMDKVVSVHSR